MEESVENVHVMVRIRPTSEEDLAYDGFDCVEADGQILKVWSKQDITKIPNYMVPLTPKSKLPPPPKTPKYKSKKSISEVETETTGKPKLVKTFAFDRLFTPASSQQEVFEEVQPFVESAVAGYNATVFCYGQTGSGKTYTMVGPPHDEGIIPRTIRCLFQQVEAQPDKLFAITCSYVELYNDTFIDLLDPETHSKFSQQRRHRHIQRSNSSSTTHSSASKIEIREDTVNKRVFLAGAASLNTSITNLQESLSLLTRASQLRATSHTNCNSRSSRSHSILTFHIESRPQLASYSDSTTIGKLHLVDLAGSERLSKSLAEGETKKETQAINSSLTALGDVLSSLSSKSYNGPVPYRNSKLTRLLQDSLGGNSRTLFICNIKPSLSCQSETLMSLMYASRAKKIKNMTKLNKDSKGDSEMKRMQNEISMLRKALLERQLQIEEIRQTEKNQQADNEALRRRLSLLSKESESEIRSVELEMVEIMHSHQNELKEAQSSCENFKSQLDEMKSNERMLKLKLIKLEDEKEEMHLKMKAIKKKARHSSPVVSKSDHQSSQHLERELNAVAQERDAVMKDMLKKDKLLQATQQENRSLKESNQILISKIEALERAASGMVMRQTSTSRQNVVTEKSYDSENTESLKKKPIKHKLHHKSTHSGTNTDGSAVVTTESPPKKMRPLFDPDNNNDELLEPTSTPKSRTLGHKKQVKERLAIKTGKSRQRNRMRDLFGKHSLMKENFGTASPAKLIKKDADKPMTPVKHGKIQGQI